MDQFTRLFCFELFITFVVVLLTALQMMITYKHNKCKHIGLDIDIIY